MLVVVAVVWSSNKTVSGKGTAYVSTATNLFCTGCLRNCTVEFESPLYLPSHRQEYYRRRPRRLQERGPLFSVFNLLYFELVYSHLTQNGIHNKGRTNFRQKEGRHHSVATRDRLADHPI